MDWYGFGMVLLPWVRLKGEGPVRWLGSMVPANVVVDAIQFS